MKMGMEIVRDVESGDGEDDELPCVMGDRCEGDCI